MKKLITLAFVGVVLFPMLSYAEATSTPALTRDEVIGEIQAQLMVLYQKLIDLLTAQLSAQLVAPVQKIEQQAQQITQIQNTQQTQAVQIEQIQNNVGAPAMAPVVIQATSTPIASEKAQNIAALKVKYAQDIYDVEHSVGSNTTFVQAAKVALTQKYNSDLKIIEAGIIIPVPIIPPVIMVNQPVCISTTTSQWSVDTDWTKVRILNIYTNASGDFQRLYPNVNGDNYYQPLSLHVTKGTRKEDYGQFSYEQGAGEIHLLINAFAYSPDPTTLLSKTDWDIVVPDCSLIK